MSAAGIGGVAERSCFYHIFFLTTLSKSTKITTTFFQNNSQPRYKRKLATQGTNNGKEEHRHRTKSQQFGTRIMEGKMVRQYERSILLLPLVRNIALITCHLLHTWLRSGDFNEIMFQHENEGGGLRSERLMENFRKALEDCELHDLGYVGDAFTWRNNHLSATRFIKERLDRAVANTAWRCKFPLVRVINGDQRHSDHRPIIVEVGEREVRRWERPREVLRKFEARWMEEKCVARVEEAWGTALVGGGGSIMELQGKVLAKLWEWDCSVLGALEKRVKNARHELERCRRIGVNQENVNQEHVLKYKLERLEDHLHVYWKQRVHNVWLLKGDRNTKFSMPLNLSKKEINHTRMLKVDGSGVVEGKELKNFISNQYQSLFTSHAGGIIEEVTSCVTTHE